MNDHKDDAMNRDPLTGEPGAHPVGTGLGAGGGALAGAAAGAIGGPIGSVVGAVIGAVAGGLAGKGIAEMLDPTQEEAYWGDTYSREAYYRPGYTYDDYGPAYRAGWESRLNKEASWDEVRTDMQQRWDQTRGQSRLSWEEAEPAAQAAWRRAHERMAKGPME